MELQELEPSVLRINEVYAGRTVQGEGPHVGRLCTFVRLYGCNLHCRWCDTPYTWDVTGRNGVEYFRADESSVWPVADVAEHVVALDVPVCVVSGGEPMLQARSVMALADLLRVAGVDTHVETNGTRPPPAASDAVAHYSVSPKLPSAEAGANAILPDTLRLWAQHPRAIFKVVCATPDEVDQAHGLFELLGVRQDARWIMPQGVTAHEVDLSAIAVVDRVLELNLNLSPRLHVQLWGATRGK